MNDSALPGYSIGTFGSRTTQNGASVVLLAAQAVREKAVKLAAYMLEAAPEVRALFEHHPGVIAA